MYFDNHFKETSMERERVERRGQGTEVPPIYRIRENHNSEDAALVDLQAPFGAEVFVQHKG